MNKKRRKLSNIRLDAKWHQRYLGAWLALTILPIVALNCAVYYLYSNMWNVMFPTAVHLEGNAWFQHPGLALSLVVETAIFVTAIFFLAAMTGHRMSGPRIKFIQTFREIKDGNYDVRLSFREKDEMDDLAREFNEMLESLLEGRADTDPSDAPSPKLQPVGE